MLAKLKNWIIATDSLEDGLIEAQRADREKKEESIAYIVQIRCAA